MLKAICRRTPDQADTRLVDVPKWRLAWKARRAVATRGRLRPDVRPCAGVAAAAPENSSARHRAAQVVAWKVAMTLQSGCATQQGRLQDAVGTAR